MTSRESFVILIQNELKDFLRIVDEKIIIIGSVILMSDEDKQYSRRSQVEPTTIVSLPRDMKVNLPDYSDDSPAKINAAYTYGEVKESVMTVQKHFDIIIDYTTSWSTWAA